VSADVTVSGYVLNMDDGQQGNYKVVYSALYRDDITEYTVTRLTNGLPYRFTVQAVNANGYSVASSSTTLYACSDPSIATAPVKVSSTLTTMTVSWSTPESNGGCAVSSYQLYTSGTLDTSVHSSVVDNTFEVSYLTLSQTITFDTEVGSIINFRLTAVTLGGSSTSLTSSYVLGMVPSKPEDVGGVATLAEVTTETTDEQLVVQGVGLITDAETGGSSIIGYEFQVDDSNFGNYVTVQGGEDDRTTSLKAYITYGISRGLTYGVRYRGINSVGEGEWSDPIYVIASTTPARPEQPVITSASETEIVLRLIPVSNDGGEPITAYKLMVADSTSDHSDFQPYPNVGTESIELARTYTVPTFTEPEIYGFKVEACNEHRG